MKEDSKDVLARIRRLRRRPPPRRKKKARDQVGPRRLGVRGGEIDHKADDRAAS